MEWIKSVDTALFLWLNGLRSGAADVFFFHVSQKLTWIPLYLLILALIIKRFGLRGLYFLLFVVLLVSLSDQSSVWFKNTFMRFRPCHEPALEGLVQTLRGRCGGLYGFVSSHAANTAALATVVSLVLGNSFRWMVPLMTAVALLNGYSRIYLGVHYPGDVLGGFLLGMLIGWLVFRLWKYFVSIRILWPVSPQGKA